MRTLIYIAIAAVAFYFGYKMSESVMLNKRLNANILPIVDEVKIQLTAIDNKLKESITPEERLALEAKKQRLIDLLSKFYGYTVEELNNILNKSVA